MQTLEQLGNQEQTDDIPENVQKMVAASEKIKEGKFVDALDIIFEVRRSLVTHLMTEPPFKHIEI